MNVLAPVQEKKEAKTKRCGHVADRAVLRSMLEEFYGTTCT